MRALGLCLLAALGLAVVRGRMVTKCELKEHITNEIGHLSERVKQKGLMLESLLAKIICHVELMSGFNTATVTELGNSTAGRREKREAASGGWFSLAGHHLHNGATPSPSPPPPPRARRHAGPRPSGPPARSTPDWTLYGLFQLSNHLVCSDGRNPSPNICNIDCNKLIDDDISDDIGCLLTIFVEMIENGFSYVHFEELQRMIRLILQEECINQDPNQYFAECPKSESTTPH